MPKERKHMAIELTLRITLEQAAHLERLLKQDKDMQTKVVTMRHATEEERAQARQAIVLDDQLLGQY
jgi:hypothetical protein